MRFLLLTAVLMACGFPVQAERYLTLVEAQKLCFPKADRFQEQVLKFTDMDVLKIERKAGVRVANEGNRIFHAYAGEELLGLIFIDHVLGKHEIIDYAVALSVEGQVQQVEILEYRESYGYEVRNPKWRKQFAGKSVKSPLRLNHDVYNISGATMSCRNVTDGIKRILATYDLLCRPQLVSGGVSHTSASSGR